MGYSAKIKIDAKRPKEDGSAMVFLQVIINRQKAKIDLGISWPPNKFSLVDGCRSRWKNDEDVDAYNIVIGNAKTKANNIHKDYLIRDLHLTREAFLKDYHSKLNKSDFIQYFEKQSFNQWNKKLISQDTYEKEEGTLKKLKEYSNGSLPFHLFTTTWAKGFDAFLKKTFKNEINTRWGRHKHVIKYLNAARDDDKISFTDPYSKFSNRLVESSWGPLDLEQLTTLITLYNTWKENPLPILPRKNGIKQKDNRPGLTSPEVIVTRKFLFSCSSALRISDLQQLDESIFTNGHMTLTPHKTEDHGTKIKSVPIIDLARMLLEDEIAFVKAQRSEKPYFKIQRRKDTLRIFESYTDQTCNKLLKRIAAKAGFDFNLHMHMGRYTFGSLSDEAGANHTALMKQMGIRKRATLDKYVKTNAKRIENNVEKINAMIKL